MLSNSICCCAPVHRTIMPEMPCVKKLKSKIYCLYGSRDNESEESNNQPSSTFVTIGGTVKNRGTPDQELMELNRVNSPVDGENTAEVRIGTFVGPSTSSQSLGQQERPAVHIQRTFEVV